MLIESEWKGIEYSIVFVLPLYNGVDLSTRKEEEGEQNENTFTWEKKDILFDDIIFLEFSFLNAFFFLYTLLLYRYTIIVGYVVTC